MGPNMLADTKLAMLNNANIRLDGGRRECMVDVKETPRWKVIEAKAALSYIL